MHQSIRSLQKCTKYFLQTLLNNHLGHTRVDILLLPRRDLKVNTKHTRCANYEERCNLQQGVSKVQTNFSLTHSLTDRRTDSEPKKVKININDIVRGCCYYYCV